MKSQVHEGADPILYRTYWSIVLRDILYHLGFDSTRKNKQILHEFHKRVLGYKTISNADEKLMEYFIAEVCLFWAEKHGEYGGYFIRTRRDQEIGIENKPLKEVWGRL